MVARERLTTMYNVRHKERTDEEKEIKIHRSHWLIHALNGFKQHLFQSNQQVSVKSSQMKPIQV
jgi:hypothetical protein